MPQQFVVLLRKFSSKTRKLAVEDFFQLPQIPPIDVSLSLSAVENGILTPTMKLRRKNAREKFAKNTNLKCLQCPACPRTVQRVCSVENSWRPTDKSLELGDQWTFK